MEEMGEKEKARIQEQRLHLGESGLKMKCEELEKATQTNEVCK